MFTYCVRRLLLGREKNLSRMSVCRIALPFARRHSRERTTTAAGSCAEDTTDHSKALMQLCTDRYYIASGQHHIDSLQRGTSCAYGPLGMEFRKNILEQWWNSVIASRPQVFGISTLHTGKDRSTGSDGQLRVVDSETLCQILNQRQLSKDQLVQKIQALLQTWGSVRTSLFHGKKTAQ